MGRGSNWYMVFGIVHAAVFCTWSYVDMSPTFFFIVRLEKPYGLVARGKSIANHPLAIRRIRAVYGVYGVFWPHGHNNSPVCPTGSVRSIRIRADAQAWKHSHDQCTGLCGARKRPVWGPWDSVRGPIDRYVRMSRVFYSPVTGRRESLTFGHGLSPTFDCVHRSFTQFRDQ